LHLFLCLFQGDKERNILVFDLGGGKLTLDVSILSIKNRQIVTKSIAGETHLGGEDLQNLLILVVVDNLMENQKIGRSVAVFFANRNIFPSFSAIFIGLRRNPSSFTIDSIILQVNSL